MHSKQQLAYIDEVEAVQSKFQKMELAEEKRRRKAAEKNGMNQS